ncbi:hypothetical protein Nepgr_032921 [Nepenthes gracilis]|uniref:Uncharacterized protein n=1 Tax=Nepenthes gracilis TaxID=150966 RepID=A0AAD3Y6G9_NEPGR|nr:hypothetical protein Nepgr_032921 [Nepenthes gracilis]
MSVSFGLLKDQVNDDNHELALDVIVGDRFAVFAFYKTDVSRRRKLSWIWILERITCGDGEFWVPPGCGSGGGDRVSGSVDERCSKQRRPRWRALCGIEFRRWRFKS